VTKKRRKKKNNSTRRITCKKMRRSKTKTRSMGKIHIVASQKITTITLNHQMLKLTPTIPRISRNSNMRKKKTLI